MAFTEDISVFINSDTPGYVTATVYGVEIEGIFDEAYTEMAGMGLTPPTLVCSTDVDVSVDDEVVMLDTTYSSDGTKSFEVMTIEPDGTGLQRLILRAV